MTTTIQRIASSCFVAVLAAAGVAIPAPAQAQYGQQRAASQQRTVEGSQTWGQDGWLYVVQGGRWVRTNYSRRFPDRTNPNVFDIFANGQFVRRVGITAPRTSQASAATRQPTSAEIQLQQLLLQLVNELNRQVAMERARAAAASGGLYAGAPGTIGGFGSGTPNVNPLTVLSLEADRIRREGSPQLRQQLSQIEAMLGQRLDASIKVDTLGTYVRRR